MISLTGILAIAVLAGITIGLCAKSRTVRIAAWCVAGMGFLGFVLFVALVVPRILQR